MQIKEKVGKFSDYPSKQEYNKKFAEVAEELGYKNRGKARKHMKPAEWKEYKELEQLNKELKQQIKDKTFTIEEVQAEIAELLKEDGRNPLKLVKHRGVHEKNGYKCSDF